MLDLLTVALTGAGLLVGALVLGRVALAVQEARRTESFRLIFPRKVEADQVVAALRSIQGLLPRFPDRLIVTRAVSIEAVATEAGIGHRLRVPAGRAEQVIGQLRAALPGLRAVLLDRQDDYEVTQARELAAVGVGSLRTEITADSNAALLAALQPLGPDEAVVLQWTITPSEPVSGWLLRLRGLGSAEPSGEAASEPELRARCRIGVAGDQGDARLARVLGAIHRADSAERRLVRLSLPSGWAAARLRRASWPVLPGSMLAADELAAVIGVPVGGPQLPGLVFAESRTLPPAPQVPERGRVLGDAVVTGKPVAISEADSARGLLITAPTGGGKSTMLERLCAGDFAAGRGVVLVESKGDLCCALADLIPANRRRDVVVFDPADAMPSGFNLLAGSEEAADLIAEHVTGQFRALYAGYLGPRSEMLLRAALLTLSQAKGDWTICEVLPLLSDAGFRRRLAGQVTDHQLAATWAWFDSQSPPAQAEMVGPLVNKLSAFVLRRKLRAVVGQAESALDFDAILANGRIALVSLRKGLIGEDAARLIGSCILTELWAAIQRRAALPPAQRPFVSAVVDEAQDFFRLPVPLGDAVAQSRGLGVGWTVSHQDLGQLRPELRAAVLANLRSKLVMQTSADDADAFAREFRPHLDAADFQGLAAYEGYAAISTGTAVAPPASIRTRPPLTPLGCGEEVRAASRKRYGRNPRAVDAEIQARLGAPVAEIPVGSRRRG